MSNWEKNVRKVVPYVPGEQPHEADMIKLNTNENPYPYGAFRIYLQNLFIFVFYFHLSSISFFSYLSVIFPPRFV